MTDADGAAAADRIRWQAATDWPLPAAALATIPAGGGTNGAIECWAATVLKTADPANTAG